MLLGGLEAEQPSFYDNPKVRQQPGQQSPTTNGHLDPFDMGKQTSSLFFYEQTQTDIFSLPEPKAHKVSLYDWIRASTLSNTNIFETSRPITIKFYLKHHWDGGKAALGFGADQIRTLVSMANDNSHRVIMGKRPSSAVFDWIYFILADNYDIHKSLHEFEIRPDPTTDKRVSCP